MLDILEHIRICHCACAYIVSDAWHLVRPHLFLLERMMRVAVGQEVLEEAHVLQTEERNLVVGLRLSAQLLSLLELPACLPGG